MRVHRRPACAGQTSTETILIIAGVAVAALTVVTLFGNKLAGLFQKSSASLDDGAAKTTAAVEVPVDPGTPATPTGPGNGAPSGGTPGGGTQPQPPANGPSGGSGTGSGGKSPIAGGDGIWGGDKLDSEQGPHYIRGPHYEYEVIDEDGDGTYDSVKIVGTGGRGHSEGNAGGWIGYDGDLQLGYGEGGAKGHGNWGGGQGIGGQVGGARGEVGVNFGTNENPWYRIELGGAGLHAEADEWTLGGDDGRRIGYGMHAGADAGLADGRAGIEYNPPSPFWDTGFVRVRGGIDAGYGETPGGHAGSWIYYDRGDGRFHVGADLGGRLGVGLGGDVDISFGRPRPAGEGAWKD